ncbi:MAG: hypothetical protein GXO17_05145 [Thermodesulfobacteria bacterium]|nr:hypothetical protein [Thermodesulfobacteriota bacterium]
MEKVTKFLLQHSVYTLKEIDKTIKETPLETLIEKPKKLPKRDALYLDVIPENMLRRLLIKKYDNSIVLITEEKGEFNFELINKAETIIFADPTDRSKFFKKLIDKYISENKDFGKKTLSELIDSGKNIKEDWEKLVDNEPAQTSGACCSFTVIKRGKVLFAIILNYITGDIIIACEDFIAYKNVDKIKKDDRFSTWNDISFLSNEEESENKLFVTYLGKQYRQFYYDANIIPETYQPLYEEAGGPMRILHLSNLASQKVNFILSNGEKIGEWLPWLAFCKYSKDLIAYSIYPATKTFYARDDLLMTPSPPYSILEGENEDFSLNLDKLKYISNPSRYREMIIVLHKNNDSVASFIEAQKSRPIFS